MQALAQRRSTATAPQSAFHHDHNLPGVQPSAKVPGVSQVIIDVGVALGDECGKNAIFVLCLIRVVPPMPLRTLPVHRVLRNEAAPERQFTVISRCNRFGDGSAEEQRNADLAALRARSNHSHTLSDSE
jgi:hypothetical protein